MPTASYRLVKVHRDTWDDLEPISGLCDASINKSATDPVPLLESGTFTISAPIGDYFEGGWYRLEALLEDDLSYSRIPLVTMLLEESSGKVDYGHDTQTVYGRSVLFPASKRKFEARNFIPKNSNGAEWCKEMLSKCTPAPIVVDGEFLVDEHYVFDRGEIYLDSIWSVLKKAGWCMMISGNGTINITKKPEVPSFSIDRSTRNRIMPGIQYSYDLSQVPNRYIVVNPYDNYKTTVVTNTQKASRTSYSARGNCWYDEIDEAPLPMDGETMKAYASRQLEYLSTVSRVYSYTRDYIDNLVPFSLVWATIPEFDAEEPLRILTQSYRVSRGSSLAVSEQAGYEIKEYTA